MTFLKELETGIIIIPLYTANNHRSLVTPTPRFSSIPSIQDTDSLLHQVRLQENPIFWSSPVFVAPFEIPRNPTRHCSPSHIPQLPKKNLGKSDQNAVEIAMIFHQPYDLHRCLDVLRGPGPTGAIGHPQNTAETENRFSQNKTHPLERKDRLHLMHVLFNKVLPISNPSFQQQKAALGRSLKSVDPTKKHQECMGKVHLENHWDL